MKSRTVLLLLTIAAVLVGIGLGVLLKATATLTPRQVIAVSFPGTLFIRTLKMLILPLIVGSLITSLVSLDMKTASKVGLLGMAYYFGSTILAVITGIILVLAINPGSYAKQIAAETTTSCRGILPIDTILDLLRNMFPSNILEAGFKSVSSCINYKRKFDNGTSLTIDYNQWSTMNAADQDLYMAYPYLEYKNGMNVMGVVVISLAYGIVINIVGHRGRPLANFFDSLEASTMKLVQFVIWLSPIGILSLIAGQIVAMDDLFDELARLSMYMVTVMAGLAIHAFITLPAFLILLGRINPIYHFSGMLQALLTAFGTSSSSATLPVTLDCLERKLKVDSRITRFIVPLGATINMDGTALYEAVAAIYISQAVGHSLTIGRVIMISLTATLASIGAAGIPSAGLVTMIMVLVAIGLEPGYFILVVPVDWLLDRMRTAVNVLDDSVGAVIVQKWCNQHLIDLDEIERAHQEDGTSVEVAHAHNNKHYNNKSFELHETNYNHPRKQTS